jgi:FimV-like protein
MGKDAAISYAEKANRIAPNQPAFMDTLAMLLAKQSDYARAIELQNKALGLQPDNSDVRLNLAKIYIKSGDRERAKAELEKLARLGDKFPRQPVVAELLKNL